MAKKIIRIEVDEDIAQEVQEGVKGFIDDFYGEKEADRIKVSEVEDAPSSGT